MPMSVEETRVLMLVVGSWPAKEHNSESLWLLDSPSTTATAAVAAPA